VGEKEERRGEKRKWERKREKRKEEREKGDERRGRVMKQGGVDTYQVAVE
jgi:hypothetical protein